MVKRKAQAVLGWELQPGTCGSLKDSLTQSRLPVAPVQQMLATVSPGNTKEIEEALVLLKKTLCPEL
jgi:hypothetical protein